MSLCLVWLLVFQADLVEASKARMSKDMEHTAREMEMNFAIADLRHQVQQLESRSIIPDSEINFALGITDDAPTSGDSPTAAGFDEATALAMAKQELMAENGSWRTSCGTRTWCVDMIVVRRGG